MIPCHQMLFYVNMNLSLILNSMYLTLVQEIQTIGDDVRILKNITTVKIKKTLRRQRRNEGNVRKLAKSVENVEENVQKLAESVRRIEGYIITMLEKSTQTNTPRFTQSNSNIQKDN